MRALSRRESRAVAILILLAAVTLLLLAVIEPLADGFSQRAEARARLIARHDANARLIAAVPRLVREAARRDAAIDRYALSVADPSVAVDMLRQRISAATTAVGGDFRGSDDGPALPGKATIHAAVRVRAEQLNRLLMVLENAHPLIMVTALTVNADDALVTGGATDLDVQFDLAVALRPRPAARPKAAAGGQP